MIDDPLFLALAVPAVLIVGISKGGFGGGLGGVSVPLMALAVPPTLAVAVLAPILCVMDLLSIAAWRGQWDRAILRILVPAAVVGVLLGAATFSYFNDDQIRLIIGIIAAGFGLNHLLGGRLRRRRDGEGTPGRAPLSGAFWGTLGGFTSFVAHAGGPPVNVYLLARRLPRAVYQSTTVIYYVVLNYTKLVPYTLIGQFTPEVLWTAAALVPLAPVGIFLGVWMHRRMNDLWFYRVAHLFMLLTGLKLIGDGLHLWP